MNADAIPGRLNALPSPRGVAWRIMQLAQSESASVAEVAKLA